MIRLLLALFITGALLLVSLGEPDIGIPATLGYLLIMGGLRRWLIPLAGYQANDPLVLVGAAVAAVLYIRQRQFTKLPQSPLSKMMGWLLVLMALQMVNPLQGSIIVGLTSSLFYIVPVLWYFIGRDAVNGKLLRNMLGTLVTLAILAAIYSLYQTFFGFTSAEQRWIEAANFISLNVGRIRPFSFLTSPAELASLLSSAVVALATAGLCGKRWAFIPIPLVATSLFLISARGAVVSGLGAICIVWATRGTNAKTWVLRVGVASGLAVAGMGWGLGHLQENEPTDERIQSLVQHQVDGLSDPFGQNSTATSHLSMVFNGFLTGFKNPIGYGLGATSGSGGKYGGAQLSTEGDISNMFVSLGLIGGILYIRIVYLSLRNAIHLWRSTRSPIILIITGILIQQFMNWLNGGQYATVMFVWVCVGALDAIDIRLRLQRHIKATLASQRQSPRVASDVSLAVVM